MKLYLPSIVISSRIWIAFINKIKNTNCLNVLNMNLPERFSFDFFNDDTYYHDEPEINLFYIEKEDNLFLGRELIVKDVKITYYVYPISEHSGFLVFYLGEDCFDSIREALDEDSINPIRSAWPKFIEALSNGIYDNDSSYALAKFDFGSEIKFWAMYTRIENIEFDNLNTEYVISKVVKLYSYTIDMLIELRDNEPSSWKIFVNSFKSSILDGIKFSNLIRGIGNLFES